MNTYEISIQRENGTTCTDRVVAATPAEAKKFFRESTATARPSRAKT